MGKGSYITQVPLTVPSCVGWFDAADREAITSSGGLVSNVRNKANVQNPFVQATGGNQPTTGSSTMAGKNVLTFDGTSDYLSCNALAAFFTGNDTSVSAFAVYNSGSLSGSPTIFSAGNSGNNTNLFAHDNGGSNSFRVFKRDDLSVLDQVVTTVASVSSPVMMSMSCAGTTIKARKNGALFANGAFNVGVTTLNAFAIGARPTSTITSFFTGDIAEIIIYSRALSDTEVASIEDYLGNKWGISVA
jgi:hypothetical protein